MIVWRYLAGIDTGDLLRITGKMRKKAYMNILQNSRLPSRSHIIGQTIYMSAEQQKQSQSMLGLYGRKKNNKRGKKTAY